MSACVGVGNSTEEATQEGTSETVDGSMHNNIQLGRKTDVGGCDVETGEYWGDRSCGRKTKDNSKCTMGNLQQSIMIRAEKRVSCSLPRDTILDGDGVPLSPEKIRQLLGTA